MVAVGEEEGGGRGGGGGERGGAGEGHVSDIWRVCDLDRMLPTDMLNVCAEGEDQQCYHIEGCRRRERGGGKGGLRGRLAGADC